MTINDIKAELKTEKYDFLRNHKSLGRNMILLGLGGSYAYGTNNENSDLDVRGAALNSGRDILLKKDFEQVTDTATDTTVYSFDKLITLLVNCNPNTIELLGLKPEHYLYVGKAGRQLLDNREIFLSQRAAHSFGGYANQQLRRLENGSARSQDQHLREQHLLKVLNGVTDNFMGKFAKYHQNAVSMYIDKSERMGEEIYVDFDFKRYPLRDFNMILAETSAIEREYSKLGMRNSKAIEHGKLEKHAMHLVRLYYMAFDILERRKIVTYREEEHDLLMSIRNGAFSNERNLFSDEFYEMADGLEKRLEYAEKNTDLPKEPDYKRIEDFVVSVNREILKERG
ncbi:MAG: nucleotidyltransferase domain-containing protein [Oscillospiraceae bacterium]|nr:nucleotidyltransferase domain-containing protein [Oscillospiraceae bacterium]